MIGWFACVSCGFRLRNARNASDCVWMETGLKCMSVSFSAHLSVAHSCCIVSHTVEDYSAYRSCLVSIAQHCKLIMHTRSIGDGCWSADHHGDLAGGWIYRLLKTSITVSQLVGRWVPLHWPRTLLLADDWSSQSAINRQSRCTISSVKSQPAWNETR